MSVRKPIRGAQVHLNVTADDSPQLARILNRKNRAKEVRPVTRIANPCLNNIDG